MKIYDVVVVGAGPAGASAARSAASMGACVLMVERKTAVGFPVRCAEYIPAPLLGEIDIGHEFLVQRVRGMKTFLPDGEEKTTLTPGLMIRRDLFDQALCSSAQDAGAELMLDTAAVSFQDGRLRLRQRGGNLLEIETKVIIGADGPHSRVGKWMGSVNGHLIAAVQARVPLVQPLEHTEVYFDKGFFGGYGWLFPKGEEANVGLGISGNRCNSRMLPSAIEGFLERLVKEGKIRNAPSIRTAGWVPSEPLRAVVKGQFMLAGDAAGHTHPITGAGVFQAVVGGKMAGKWAATAVVEKDLTLLTEYEEEWRDLFGETHERAFQRRLLLDGEWERLDQVIKKCWVAFREYYADR